MNENLLCKSFYITCEGILPREYKTEMCRAMWESFNISKACKKDMR